MRDRKLFLDGTQTDRAKKELCVLCGRETEYLCTKPVSERFFYVEGAGQLCPDCYRSVFHPAIVVGRETSPF